MGDPRRFDLFSRVISGEFSDRTLRIADVAGGKGYLQIALRERGFSRVTTFDKRHKRAGRSLDYTYRFFGESVREDFHLIVGMHPDEATDEIIAAAHRRKVPFAICPCCVRPSAYAYWGDTNSSDWRRHLSEKAASLGFEVSRYRLRMDGANHVIIGRPA